jgi:hypothetical protein
MAEMILALKALFLMGVGAFVLAIVVIAVERRAGRG